MRAIVDIPWIDDFVAAQQLAQRRGRALVIKALGQGCIPPHDW